jgi:ABC-type transport system substrate-binding protein
LGEDIPMMPKHIWENIKDPNTYQPITEGNLIGSGPYRFKEYKPGEYVILEANPNYFHKPKGSTLGYTSLTLTQGESKAFSRSAVYEGTPITNGTYTLTLTSTAGAILKTVSGTAAANGNYTVTLDTTSIQPGSYLLVEKLAVPVFTSAITGTPVGLGSLEDYQLTVTAPPPNYALYAGALVVIIVIIAAGYMVLRRRGKPT